MDSTQHISQVVFVDNSVTDHETLLTGIIEDISPDSGEIVMEQNNDTYEQTLNGIQIVTLDASHDEFQQITDTLSGYSNLDGIHILSHGSNSSLRLGNTIVDSDNIDEYSSRLGQWGNALNEDGDLLLYGCNVAEDGTGVEFVESMASVTGADVAASDDATGNEATGGDWELEVSTGKIDVHVLHDASGNWGGLLAPPLPTSLDAATNTEPMINSQFVFTVSFDNDTSNNAATDTGYGPFVDVIVPHEIQIIGSPTIFGSAVSPEIFTWNGTGWEDSTGTILTEHPGETTGSVSDTDLEMPQGSFDVGDKWYYLVHPFGSYTTGQPAIDANFTAVASTTEGAQVGTDYEIFHRAGFNFGDTATNEHGPIQETNTGSLSITPQVLDIHKINNAPEAQTVTGPNYPVEYTLRVNIAGNETVNDVVVQDYLPEGAVYRGDVTIAPVSGSGAPAVTPVSTTEPTAWTVLGADANDRLLELNLGDLTGVDNPDSGHTEWEIKYTVYFSDVDADGNPLLPTTGGDMTVENQSGISGQYAGDTVSDGVNSDNDTPSDNTIQLASIVTYKDVSVVGGGDPVPNATLEWSVEVDISDYYAGGNIVFNDVFGDGQTFDSSFTPTIVLHENGTTTSGNFDAANFLVGTEDAYDGQGGTTAGTGLTQVVFNVSDQFQAMGDADGVMEGGFIADGTVIGADQAGDTLNDRIGGDGTYATITFRTVIDQEFDEFQDSADGTGDSSVDLGDSINNDVDVTADIADSDPTTPDQQQGDHSSDGVVIKGGKVVKETYAVNGDTNYDLSNGVSSGDEITYRLRMELPLADFENLVVSDFLPLPVYDVNELNPATDANDFDGTIDFVAGEVEFGPDHTLDGTHITDLQHEGVDVGASPLKPAVSFDTTNNSISFDFGSYDAPGDAQPVVIDVLLTVTIQNQAMVDGLQLTNQGEWSINNTTSHVTDVDDIVQITLNEPDVHIVKGVVNTDNTGSTLGSAQGPGELTFNADGTISITAGDVVEAQELVDSPVDADLINADGSDLVTFALTIYNRGGDNAYDINVTDTMPTGFVQPGAGINLHVYDGTGALLVKDTDYTVTGDDFYANGEINFNNTALTGNSADRGHDGGTDVFIITYQLQVDNETTVDPDVVIAGSHHENTATIDFFTGVDDGTTDWTDTVGEPTDNATVSISDPEVAKTVISTSEASTPGLVNVVIGETVTYTVTVTVPEGGINNFSLDDTLDNGLAIVSLDQIDHGNLITDYNGGNNWDQVLTDARNGLSSPGHTFSINFGDVTNTDSDNDTTDEQIIITYTAVVLNTSGNQQNIHLDNVAHVTWDDPDNPGSTTQTADVNSPDVIVQEADLQIIKEIQDPSTGTWVDADDADHAVHHDQGDTIYYRITIDSNRGHSHENAFDAVFTDTLPAGLDITNATVTHDSGLAPTTWNYDNTTGQLTANWDDFDVDQNSVFLVTTTLTSATAGQVTTNTGTVSWESLDSDNHKNVGEEISPYNTNSGERTGDTGNIGGSANDYTDSDPAVIAVIGSIDKTTNPDPSEHTIGDTVTYDIVVTLPEGHTENLVVTDALPIGLQYVTHSIDTANFGGTLGTLSVNTPLADGDDIVFTFADTTTVDADGDTTNNSFTIQVTALVTTTASNVQEQDLTNEASMQFDDPAGGDPIVTEDPTDPTIHVVEPQITTVKDVADSADADTDASPGETLTYTARFTNTGHSTAYEVTADDILPAGVTYNTASATISDSSGLLSAADVTSSVSGNTVSFSSSDGGWDIAVGGYVEIQYTVTVMAAGFQGGNHVNTIDADWSSQNGTDPYERTYDDSGTSPVDGDQDADNAAFTVVATASLGDTVFFDAAGDGGPFDAASGDVGISGVDVTISADVDGDGTPEFTQTVRTDADGRYEFTNLAAFDNYVISVDPATSGGVNPTDLTAAGFHQTYDLDEGTVALDNTATSISLTSGQHRTDIDFGYTGQNSVGDTVWFDVDGDGVQDDGTTGTPAEDGIGGLTVTLTADIDGDGVDEYTATTTTDEHGHYSFDHLPAGDYDITVTPPAGSTPTYDQDGGTGSPDNTTPFTLGADQDRDDIDFGIQGTGSIGDYVWYDADADSNQNDGIHAGLAGVTVTLSGDIDGDGTTDYTATTTTADDGSYSFDHLLGGTYTITVDDTTLPGGSSNWHQTYDEDGTGSANTVDHVLAAGSNDDTVDFGYTGTGSLGDTVWYDVNNNGVQEGTELGLAGVTVTISADVDGDGVDEYTDTAVTDAGGNYHFDHLPAADYTISVATGTLPAGATPTYDLDSATSSPDSTTLYTLGVGENTDRVDFGYTGSGAIGDTVWNDSNGDGILDPDENGFAGVTVTLTGDLDHDGQADDTITTTTDENGHYSFENLFLGDYTVAVDPATLPAGNSQTHDLDDPHTTTPTTPNSASVTLDAANPVNNDVDFGYNSKGTIGDTIWYDADNDGILDPGELGLAGVTVTLTGDVDGDGNPDTVVATTDSDGHYLFDQLQAGDYTITVSNLPAGMSQTADPDGVNDNTTTLTLAGGETNLDQDFGYTGTGSIGDTIWSDADGDGTQNNGETGLAGVTVTLTADLNNDGVVDTVTTTTDANGNYHFDNLPADNYTITVDPSTLPPGMQPTADPDGTNDNSATVTLAAGETNNDQDFGYQQTGTIGDTIWYDADGDGIQDPDELGLNGVTVTLTDANGNTVATTTTGSDGKYLFDNLNGGDYTITLTGLPAGMTQTADPDGGNDNASQVTIGGTSPLVNLDQDFGYTGTGSIGDTIWNDVDGNGTQDNGESGLAGVTVTLTGDFNGDGIPDIVTTTTDSNGQYHFGHLPEGQYTITVDPNTLPPGMQPTADPDGGNDNTANVTLAAGEANNDQDFGYQQSGTIGDTIWYDANGNGVQDPGELGLANVQVTLVGDLDGDGQADDTLTTVTDGDGHYLFDKLPAGTYAVTVDSTTLPAGMEETYDLDGTGSTNTAQVTIGDNEANLDVDFGYKGTGSIGDTIWYDADNDGVQDPGEAGIPGVTVTITGDFDNDGQADDTMTVTTGPDGTYLFPNLPAGEYDITVDPATLPDGMQPAGDPDTTLDNTTHLSLTAGEINLDQDFGYTGSGSIGDQVWNDRNGNGVLDPGEAPLPGVQVCIGVDLDGDGTPDYHATTTTDADGTYLFDNLPAGTHTICINPDTLPPGIRPSFDPDGVNDNTTTVTLGIGEHNRAMDFGYQYPPPPQPAPIPPIVPPTPEPVPGFGSDPLLSYQQFGDREIKDIFIYPLPEIPWQEAIIPVSPIYTGHAEPGTTLEFTLYDVMGNQIGQQSIMADTAGNWLVDFPGTIMYDLPHHMAITQTISSYNVSSAGFFNMRTYFSPNFSSMVFSSTTLDVDTIFAYLPSTILDSMHAANMSAVNIQWDDFNEYEFFAPSTQPAKTGH